MLTANDGTGANDICNSGHSKLLCYFTCTRAGAATTHHRPVQAMPPQSEDLEHMSATLGFLPGPKPAPHSRVPRTVHEHFAQACQGRETLDALVDDTSSLCFAELHSSSTLLARQLINATRGSESTKAPVAVCVDGFPRSLGS